MAFVRWRGGYAQLLASVWEDGRSRQMLLTHWPGFAASVALREAVAARFPTLTVDGAPLVPRDPAAAPPGTGPSGTRTPPVGVPVPSLPGFPWC